MLIIIIIIGCIIKYIRDLLESEYLDQTQSVSTTDKSLSNVTAIAHIAKIITNLLPSSITNSLATQIIKINSDSSKINNVVMLNGTDNFNKYNINSSFISNIDAETNGRTDLPWDEDPKLGQISCDFSFDERPDKLEKIVIY